MAISPKDLGRRLREAREACGLTQEHVGKKLRLSRSTIAQMELGNRDITSLELDQLGFLYGRDIRSFLAADFAPQDALTVLFRANPDLAENEVVAEELRRCILIGRELSNLEELVGIERSNLIPALYPLGIPKNRWEAIQQGNRVAAEERRRLDLGEIPLLDVADILENQGIRIATRPLPEDVSGLMIHEPEIGAFIVANESQSTVRQRFSFAHEYLHVLLDRERSGSIISRGGNRDELPEVRANAFAAAFLMPDSGVRRFMHGLGKGQPGRGVAEAFDGEAAVRAQRRAQPRSQEIKIYDLVRIARSFGVSTIAALYRLRNMGMVSEEMLEELKALIDDGTDKEIAKFMGLPDPDLPGTPYDFKGRFLGLALEAFRRDLISRSKLKELASLVNVAPGALKKLVEDSGVGSE